MLLACGQERVFDLGEAAGYFRGCPSEFDATTAHHVDPVGVSQGFAEVLFDQEHGCAAFVRGGPYRFQEAPCDEGAQTHGELVRQQDPGLAAEGPPEGQHLLLPA